jgi:hypothetical protein
MHEFELGVWKALFIHLLRMLNAVDRSLVDELDRRYVDPSCQLSSTISPHLIYGAGSFRQVPTFGRDTIRQFVSNVSQLKRLAARDFADLLQVCVKPTFERACDNSAITTSVRNTGF